MGTKETASQIQQRAIKEVARKLRSQQSKLRMDIDARAFEIKRLNEKQTQEKREMAELGRLIKQLNL